MAAQVALILNAMPDLPDEYAWVIPGYHDMVLRQLAGFAKVHAKKLPKLPFSFRYVPGEYRYVRQGSLALQGMHGFTCATYVLSILDWLKLKLLDYDTWDYRPDDETTQRYILQFIHAPPEHLANMATEIPCSRFRPQEVAGACLIDAYPVPMAIAEPLGDRMLHELEDFYGRTGGR